MNFSWTTPTANCRSPDPFHCFRYSQVSSTFALVRQLYYYIIPSPVCQADISTKFTALAYNYRCSCNSIDNKDWNPNFAHKCSSLTINAWTTLIKLYFLKGFKDYSFVYLKWFCFLHCVLFIKLRDTIRWIRFPLRSPSLLTTRTSTLLRRNLPQIETLTLFCLTCHVSLTFSLDILNLLLTFHQRVYIMVLPPTHRTPKGQ